VDAEAAGFELEGRKKPQGYAGSALRYRGRRTAKNGCPTVAVRYAGKVDGENGCSPAEWSVKGEGGRQGTENMNVTCFINKLDKDTLNLYTARRAYG
jgi:hypothetical protein